MEKKRKTTITMPVGLLKEADKMGRVLGVGRNGFISMSVGLALLKFNNLEIDKLKRKQLYRFVANLFQNLLTAIERKA